MPNHKEWGWWWCAPDQPAILEFSNNKKTLDKYIDSLKMSGGTGSDIGAAWGYRILSPNWKGKFKNSKVRGGKSKGRKSKKGYQLPMDHTAETKKIAIILTDGDVTFQNYPRYSGYANSTASRNFASVCKQMRNDGITVYTIGYDIGRSGWMTNLLRNCASDPSKFINTNGTKIREAFKHIATDISALRVSN